MNERSDFLKLNARDFVRGLVVAGLTGLITVIVGIDDVRDFAQPDLWLDAVNSSWKAISAYLILNFLSKK